MVSASRCNLLSRSLPNYQKEILSFYDEASNEFHKILVDLRSHHHHQYKVRRLAEEIRDLEAEYSPFSDESGLLSQSKLSSSGDVPLLDLGNGTGLAGSTDAAGEGTTGDNTVQAPPKRMLGSDQLSIEKIQEEAKVKDLALSGIEAELRELQKEVLQPSTNEDISLPAPDQQSGSATGGGGGGGGGASNDSDELNEFRDLLQLDEDEEETAGDPSKMAQPSQDKLFDDWSSFSTFMNTSAQEEGAAKSSTSGWEKELMAASSDDSSLIGLDLQEGGTLSPTQATKGETLPTSTPSSPSQISERQADGKDGASVEESREAKEKKINDGSGQTSTVSTSTTGTIGPESSDLLSEDLKALGISPEMTAPSTKKPAPLEGDVGTLDPSYFNPQLQPIMSSTIGAPQSAAPSSMMMVVAPPPYPGSTPTGQQPQMFRSPQSNSHRPILAPSLASGYQMTSLGQIVPPLSGMSRAVAPGPGLKANGRHVADGKDKETEKSASWMNVFAHLDPLVNEKV